MIPPFDRRTGELPPGIHEATWDEFETRYATTPHRRALLRGLEDAIKALQAAGCRRVYVDGSFVSAKLRPGDFDACWATAGVDIARLRRLAPELLDFSRARASQKQRYGGELFPAESQADPSGATFLDYFQRNRTGQGKGIVLINLESTT